MRKFAQRGIAPIAVLLPLLFLVLTLGLVVAVRSRTSGASFAANAGVCQSVCANMPNPGKCMILCGNVTSTGGGQGNNENGNSGGGWQGAPSQSTSNNAPVGSGTTAVECQNLCSNKSACLSACATKGGTTTQCQQICSSTSCVSVCMSQRGSQGQNAVGGQQSSCLQHSGNVTACNNAGCAYYYCTDSCKVKDSISVEAECAYTKQACGSRYHDRTSCNTDQHCNWDSVNGICSFR